MAGKVGSVDPAVDLTQLVERLGFTRSFWRKTLRQGLPHVRVGDRSRAKVWVKVSDAEAFIAQYRATEPGPQPEALRR